MTCALASGKDELLKDNEAINAERANLWKTMGKLEQMIHISKTLDQKLEDKANELDATDRRIVRASANELSAFRTPRRSARPPSSIPASVPPTCSPRWR